MVTAHRNEGIAPLDKQIKGMFPGIVIGWIGDPAHQEEISDHNPNSAGRVNAIDVMIGPAFTWNDAVLLANTLASRADKRINYIIFDRHIWDDANGYWTRYYGDDPHTNHIHISVHDNAYTNTSPWNLTPLGQEVEDMDTPTLVAILKANNAQLIKDVRNSKEFLSDTEKLEIEITTANRVIEALKTAGVIK